MERRLLRPQHGGLCVLSAPGDCCRERRAGKVTVRQVRRALRKLYEDNSTIWVYVLLLVAAVALAFAITGLVEFGRVRTGH